MAIRFQAYRMTDASTPLAQSYFNPVFQDLDVRMDALEQLKISWEAAVSELQVYGLQRLDAGISPLLAQVRADVESLVATINGYDGLITFADIAHFVPAVAAAVTYDGQGRVATLSETLSDQSTRTTTYGYTPAGLVETETLVVGSVRRVTTYSYNGQGLVTGWTVTETEIE